MIAELPLWCRAPALLDLPVLFRISYLLSVIGPQTTRPGSAGVFGGPRSAPRLVSPAVRPSPITETLEAAAAKAGSAQAACRAEAESYDELLRQLRLLEERRSAPVETLLDLGSEMYVRARLPRSDRVCVHVGLGFHPELTLPEARAAAERRARFLLERAAVFAEEEARLKAALRLWRVSERQGDV